MFIDFSKAFDSIQIRKMEQILLVYGFPKETVTVIMMLYKNMKAMVCSTDDDTDFFDIINGDTLVPYLFITCLGYLLQISIYLMKENDFTLKKSRSKQYPAKIITDVDYADDLVLLTNTPARVEFLRQSLEGRQIHISWQQY